MRLKTDKEFRDHVKYLRDNLDGEELFDFIVAMTKLERNYGFISTGEVVQLAKGFKYIGGLGFEIDEIDKEK